MDNIKRVQKKGDWYVVEGVYNGRPVSADIHAKDVDGKSRADAERALKRAVEIIGDYERGQ